MRKSFLLFILCLVSTVMLHAQNTPSPNVARTRSELTKVIRCAATEHLRRMQELGLAESDQDFENWMSATIAKDAKDRKNAPPRTAAVIYTIPVVVHVYHSGQAVGTGFNITAAQVQSQINRLNLDFQKLNTDVGSVPAIWTGVTADVQIQFCLAKIKNSDGTVLAETGIDRRLQTGMAAAGVSTATADTYKAASIWCADSYFNLWSIPLSGGILGYATFPSTSGLQGLSGVETGCTTAGAVMDDNAFGDNVGLAAGNAPYNRGRTATHEVGHCFGLRHIWGDATTCASSDFCADTPPHSDANYEPAAGGCFTHPYKTGACAANTTGEMTMNYMDYTNDACMYMFTNDQKTRAHTVMLNSPRRRLLPTSQACLNPVPVAAILTSNKTSLCLGQSATFNDATDYTGTIKPTSWVYSFATTGGAGCTPPASVTVTNYSTPATAVSGTPIFGANTTGLSPAVTFSSPGVYTITMVATYNINSANPSLNACTGCYTTTRTATRTITVYPVPTVTMSPASAANCVSYIRLTATGVARTQCGVTNVGPFTYTWSPATALTSTSGAIVQAYPSAPTTYSVVATDANGCPATVPATINMPACVSPTPMPVQLIAFEGQKDKDNSINLDWMTAEEESVSHFEIQRRIGLNEFETIGKAKATNTQMQHRYDFTDDKAPKGMVYYRLKMVDYNGAFAYTNVVGIENTTQKGGILNIYPNPTRSNLSVVIDGKNASSIRIDVVDMLGKTVWANANIVLQNGLNTIELPISQLDKGSYIVRGIQNNQVTQQLFVKE